MAKKKTMVKLDSALIEVDPSAPKGKDSRVLTEDEVFDLTVLDGHIDRMLKNDVNKIANKAYKGVLTSLEQNLREATIKALGFESDFGGWRVDHCNGRMSEISNLITAETKRVFAEGAEKVIRENIQTLMEELQPAIRNDLKDSIRRQTFHCARPIMEKMVNDFLTSCLQEEIKKMEPALILKAKARLLGKDLPSSDD